MKYQGYLNPLDILDTRFSKCHHFNLDIRTLREMENAYPSSVGLRKPFLGQML